MEPLKFYLLVTNKNYDSKSKYHIAKNGRSANTYCGKHLSFDFEILSENGVYIPYFKHEILQHCNICKTCLKNFNKNIG